MRPLFWIFLSAAPLFFSKCAQAPASETATVVLVPADFRGYANVFLGEPCGAPVEQDHNAPLLRLPPDGTLVSQQPVSIPLDYQHLRFFSENGGARTALPLYNGNPAPDERTLYVFVAERGNGHSMALDFFYLRFFVGTGADIRKAFNSGKPAEGAREALLKLKNCRQIINK